VQKSCPGKATMHPTKWPSVMFLRLSPSPDCLDESDGATLLAMTQPPVPLVASAQGAERGASALGEKRLHD